MRKVAIYVGMFLGSATSAGALPLACGGGQNAQGFDDGGGAATADGGTNHPSSNGDGGSGAGSSPPVFTLPDAGDGGSAVTYSDAGCAGLQCAIASSCTNDGGTTITGKIMDPAGANPLYNVLAYVPMYDPAQRHDGGYLDAHVIQMQPWAGRALTAGEDPRVHALRSVRVRDARHGAAEQSDQASAAPSAAEVTGGGSLTATHG